MTLKLSIALGFSLVVGLLDGRAWQPEHGTASVDPASREDLSWVAPMDPNFRRDEPGKSPMGMDLVPV